MDTKTLHKDMSECLNTYQSVQQRYVNTSNTSSTQRIGLGEVHVNPSTHVKCSSMFDDEMISHVMSQNQELVDAFNLTCCSDWKDQYMYIYLKSEQSELFLNVAYFQPESLPLPMVLMTPTDISRLPLKASVYKIIAFCCVTWDYRPVLAKETEHCWLENFIENSIFR